MVESEKYHAWGNSFSVIVEELPCFHSEEETLSPHNRAVTASVMLVTAAMVPASVALHKVRHMDGAFHEKYPDSWCCGKGFS
jgi:hypothetical protein